MTSELILGILLSAGTLVILTLINALVLRQLTQRLQFIDPCWENAWKVVITASIIRFVLGLPATYFSKDIIASGQQTALAINTLFMLVNAAVFIWLIKRTYQEPFRKTLLTWFIIVVIDAIVGTGIGALVAFLV